jgi:hypothetical protein
MPQINEGAGQQKAVQPADTGVQASTPTVRVTFARDYTVTGIREDKGGETVYVEREYKNGETVDLPSEAMDQVLMYGHATPEDPELARRYGLGQGPKIARRSEAKKEG